MKGKVKNIVYDGGFGFIKAESGEDVFFHRTAMDNTPFDILRSGNSIEFEIEDSARGPRAINVKLLDSELEESAEEMY